MGQTQNMRLVVCVLVLLWTLQSVSARGGRGGGRGRGRGGYVGANCETYYINGESQWHSCGRHEFCCGDCEHRSCCSDSLKELTLEEQNQCYNSEENHKRKLEEERSLFDGVDWKTSWQIICGIIAGIIILMLRLFCLAKVTGSFPGDAVVATTTHTTDVAAQYPQNPTATQHNPATQRYSGYPQNPTATQHNPATQRYSGYQPGNPQSGYGMRTSPYRGQPMASAPQSEPVSASFEPPPSYQDVVGSPVINHSGAAFTPGQQSYPIQHPVHAGYQNRPASPATAPTASADFLTQTAYNPNFAAPPP